MIDPHASSTAHHTTQGGKVCVWGGLIEYKDHVALLNDQEKDVEQCGCIMGKSLHTKFLSSGLMNT